MQKALYIWCTSHSPLFPYILGDFDVINFRDVTTEDALANNTAIFEFEFDPMINVDTFLSYDLRLTWSQVSGPNSGVVETENCRFYKPSNVQLERIGLTATFRLHVPLQLLGDGCLLLNLNINISFCINTLYEYYSDPCNCNDWQIRGTSDSLEINAKRG